LQSISPWMCQTLEQIYRMHSLYQALTTGYDMTLIYGGNLLLVFISGLSGQLSIYIYFGNNF
jgi:hypothetical protein